MQKNNLAIILSGGKGERFDSKLPKQFFKINNKPIIKITVEKLLELNLFKKIIIVSNKSYIAKTKRLFDSDEIIITEGGKTRQSSVFNGLLAGKDYKFKNVIIHDAVRPFFSKKLVSNILENLKTNKSVVPSIKIFDSIRKIKKNEYRNILRDDLQLIQTPQGYHYDQIFKAHTKNKNKEFTDDSMLLYKHTKSIKIIDGELSNFKITTKKDYEFGKQIIEKDIKMNNIRVGNGFDVHKFTKGKFLILFGVKIPFNKSLAGHSDADVGFHSIVDAILGALCLGDIGTHFPPSENKWKNKESIFFMEFARKKISEENYQINNLDITLICEKPKVSEYKPKFMKSVSNALKTDPKFINIKGTTTEKLGFLGREEGIACQVSVVLSKK
ncbi:MAG: 2-C-methyl-D-erythritol 2,4-cyclodiphosphate synthase [Alphaproteobacteria bacterium]